MLSLLINKHIDQLPIIILLSGVMILEVDYFSVSLVVVVLQNENLTFTISFHSQTDGEVFF